MKKFFFSLVNLVIAAAIMIQFASCSIPVEDTTPPEEVSELKADPGDKKVTLTWTNPSDLDFSKIEITVKQGNKFISSEDVTNGEQTKIIRNLENGIEYEFILKSVDTSGNKSSGITKTCSPKATQPVPQPPSTVTLESGDSQIVVSWAPVANAAEYEIWYAASYNSTILLENLMLLKSTTSTSETITNLTNGLTYFFAIKAKNSSGSSVLSQTKSAQPIAPVPQPTSTPSTTSTQTKNSIPTGKLTAAQVTALAPEIKWHHAEEKRIIDNNNYYMVSWAHAIPINSLVTGSQQPKIEMDYLRVYRKRNGSKWEKFIEDDYNDGSFDTSINSANPNGTLCTRDPWYNPGEEEIHYDGFNASESNSILSFTMDKTDKIYHWWTDSSQDFASGDGYKLETRVRISGPALFQIGADLKTSPGESSVDPICTSDWYASTNGEWIPITVECLEGYVENPLKRVTFNVTFKNQYINKIESVQIGGDWNTSNNNWTFVNMNRKDSLNYSFEYDFPANTSHSYNIKFIPEALNDHWVAERGCKSSYVYSCTYVIDGKTYTPELVPNGLQGQQESQNLLLSIP